MKNIWYFHQYATTPNYNGHLRPYLFAKNCKNIKITVFASSFLYFTGDNLIKNHNSFLLENVDGVDFVFLKTRNVKKKIFSRINGMFDFSKSLTRNYKKLIRLKIVNRPDAIICSSPDLLVLSTGEKIAKKLKVPCICEVRDLWPENLFNDISFLKEKSILGKCLTNFEHKIYKKSDAIVFTKEGDINYLKEKQWLVSCNGDVDDKKCFYINNGVDFEKYNRDLNNSKFTCSTSKKIITYAGAISGTNNVLNIVECARLMKSNQDVVFHIYGFGGEVSKMLSLMKKYDLDNIFYFGRLERCDMPKMLSYSFANLLNYGNNYNWTRGNSSNKLFEYMASGRPVISSAKMNYSPLNKYLCGIEASENTPEGLRDAINYLLSLSPLDYSKMCSNAKKGAKEFDYVLLSSRLENVVNYVIKGDL